MADQDPKETGVNRVQGTVVIDPGERDVMHGQQFFAARPVSFMPGIFRCAKSPNPCLGCLGRLW